MQLELPLQVRMRQFEKGARVAKSESRGIER